MESRLSQSPSSEALGVPQKQVSLAQQNPARSQTEHKANPNKRSRGKRRRKQQPFRLTPEQAIKKAAQTDGTLTCKSSKRRWTPFEDKILREVVLKNGAKNWKKIATAFNSSLQGSNRSAQQCSNRWLRYLKPGLKKGLWTSEEDATIREMVENMGSNKWSRIAKRLPGRNGRQCRIRWSYDLDPSIKRGAWTAEEDKILLTLQKSFGNKWTIIAKSLPGRTNRMIASHYYHIANNRAARTKLCSKKTKSTNIETSDGIDPTN